MIGVTFDEALRNVEVVRNELFLVSVPAGYQATTTLLATSTVSTLNVIPVGSAGTTTQ
jgi:hypothetical protein